MVSVIEKVRSRKKNLSLIIDGINFGQVIALKSYDGRLTSTLKELVRLCLFSNKIEVKGNIDSDCSLFYSLKNANRSDYNEIISMFLKFNSNFKYIELLHEKSFENIFIKLFLLLKNTIKFGIYRIENPFLTAILVSNYMLLKKKIDDSNLFTNMELMVTFCDAYPPDNLITQMSKLVEKKSITLQHGQYRVLSEGNEIADAEAYENFISDYMFVWGQATVDEFLKYGTDNSRLLKAGALRSFSFNKPIQIDTLKKAFGVILCGESYRSTNIQMIKLANEFALKHGIPYYLRFHPKNPIDYYMSFTQKQYVCGQLIRMNNDDYAKLVDFSLIHMTGVFVELLSINSPIVIFHDDYLEDVFKIEQYCIKNELEMSTFYNLLLKDAKSVREDQYLKYHYFNESPEDIEKKYKFLILTIMEK